MQIFAFFVEKHYKCIMIYERMNTVKISSRKNHSIKSILNECGFLFIKEFSRNICFIFLSSHNKKFYCDAVFGWISWLWIQDNESFIPHFIKIQISFTIPADFALKWFIIFHFPTICTLIGEIGSCAHSQLSISTVQFCSSKG